MIRLSLRLLAAACVLSAAALVACAGRGTETKPDAAGGAGAEQRRAALAPVPLPTMADTNPRDYAGIHNAVAYHPGYISGSQPEGDTGYASLAAMGVRTIISVDGAEPDVETARAYGMKYIHLPIGYNGFDEERRLQLARASRDALKNGGGAVYIHCHHGKHRSAGAAAAVAATLGWETPAHGVARMKVSGTAPNYKGLYACAEQAQPVDAAMIDAVNANFPERWKPSSYVAGMNDIDAAFENLKEIQLAGWVTPNDHPDLVPIAEAGRLADLYRVLHTDAYVKRKEEGNNGKGFTDAMAESHRRAQTLEDMLEAVTGVPSEKEKAKLTEQFKLVSASCKDCHGKYRD